MILNDMRERLAELEAQMAKHFENLKVKYGDDVIGGMAQTFLTEEERAGLKTDEEIMRALADKFLDENGNIKPEYKDTEEAKYVQSWNEAQKLKPVIAQYEGRNNLTQQERADIIEVAKEANLAEQESMYLQSANDELKDTVAQVVDENRIESEVKTQSTVFAFAKPT